VTFASSALAIFLTANTKARIEGGVKDIARFEKVVNFSPNFEFGIFLNVGREFGEIVRHGCAPSSIYTLHQAELERCECESALFDQKFLMHLAVSV